MEQRINQHGAAVGHDAAAGMLLLRVPGANARDVAVPVREGARVIDLAEVAVLDGEPRRLRVFVEAEVLRDHRGAAVLLRGGNDLRGFLRVHRHRFFDEHMLACVERIHGDGGMEEIRQRNGHGINVRLFEQFLVIRVAARDVKFLGGLAQALRVDLSNGDSSGALAMQEGVEMLGADGTNADDRATKFFAHKWNGF